MTLYDDLGVATDADAAAIKAAHRRGVNKHHPDKPGGDRDAFEKVQRAFVILSDPEKREKYDRDGETEAKPDRRAEQVLSLALKAFRAAMQGAGSGRDLVRDATAVLDEMLNNGEKAARSSETRAGELAGAKGRLRHRGQGDDFLGAMLDQEIEAAQKNAERIRDEMQLLVEAQKRLASYHFDAGGDRPEDYGDQLVRSLARESRNTHRPVWTFGL